MGVSVRESLTRVIVLHVREHVYVKCVWGISVFRVCVFRLCVFVKFVCVCLEYMCLGCVCV